MLDPLTLMSHEVDRPSQGAEELLNLAAIEVLKRAGTVYVFDRGEMPHQAIAAAMYRYSVTV